MLWFDLDDTLWAMTENSNDVLRRLYHENPAIHQAFPEGEERWMDVYHAVNAELWRDYAAAEISRDFLRRERFARPLRMGGLNAEEADRLAAYLDTHYLDLLGACKGLLPGARELLERVDASRLRKPGIISNGFREVQHRKMASAGISDYFSAVVLSDDIEVNKPDRRLFDYALEVSGTRAEDSIIVGDNPLTDILGALRADWAQAIWYNPKDLPVPPELEPYIGRLRIAHTLEDVEKALRLIY